jgi:hypothetical protein
MWVLQARDHEAQSPRRNDVICRRDMARQPSNKDIVGARRSSFPYRECTVPTLKSLYTLGTISIV